MKKIIILLLMPVMVNAQKNDEFYKKGKIEFEKRNYNDAYTYFSMAGNEGNINGVLKMGEMIVKRQQGAGIDYSNSIKLFRSIASPQYPDIYVSIGYSYFYDELYRNNDSVLYYFNLGYKYHSPRAALALGTMYFKGELVKSNPNLAEKYLLEAINGGMPAHSWLGNLYLKGREGFPKNVIKAIGIFEQGVKIGDTYCMSALGRIYYEGVYKKENLDSAVSLYKRAKDEGNFHATNYLSILFLQEKNPKYYNPKLSLELFNYIRDNADAYTLGQIGNVYWQEIESPKDYTKAIYLLKQAFKKGEKSALLSLSSIYEKKYNEDNQKYASLDSAILYLKEARKNNFIQANYNLGVMYSKDDNFIFDSARYYFEIAKKNGVIQSYFSLGIIYTIQGNGVQEKFRNDLEDYTENTYVTKKKDAKKINKSIAKAIKENILKAKEYYLKALEYYTEGYKLTNDEKYKKEITELNILLSQLDKQYTTL